MNSWPCCCCMVDGMCKWLDWDVEGRKRGGRENIGTSGVVTAGGLTVNRQEGRGAASQVKEDAWA